MTRFLSIYVLLTAILLTPCAAQLKSSQSMDDVRRDLARYQPDAKRAELLLELAFDYVLKPGEYANDLDSAILLIKQAESINQRLQNKAIEARAYFVYSNALREGGKKAEGLANIEKAVTVYRTVQEPEAAGKAWFEMAEYYFFDDDKQVAKKRECFDSARVRFRNADDRLNEAYALKNMGDCNSLMDNENDAMKEEMEALAIYKNVGYRNIQGVYDLLGIVSNIRGDYSDAVKFGLLALSTAESLQDTSLQLCTIYNRLGLSYTNLGAQDQALLYWNKAFQVAKKYHALAEMRILMLNLCVGYSRVGRYGEIIPNARAYEAILNGRGDKFDSLYLTLGYALAYAKLGDWENAGKRAEDILFLLNEYPEWQRKEMFSYPYLVGCFMTTGQYLQALKYASVYRDLAVDNGEKKFIARGYELMAAADSALGNNGAALADYKSYKKCTDSMLNESTGFQFAEKQVEYETDKKDNDIRLLKQQEEIQKARLAQTRATNTLVVISIGVLVLLLALLYNRYRVKQRLNKKLQVKQQQINEKNEALRALVTEKEWLVKEMHHRVKNNLQIIMSLQNTQTAYLKDETAISAMRESQHRVQAISLLHQKLYQSENLAVIDMPSYVKEVTEYVAENLDATPRIDFEVNVAPIALDVSQAVPLGLIVNEAITNAIKYAFPNGNKGQIRVSIETAADGRMLVTIQDNGIGLPEGYDGLLSPSLGMSLMKGLSKQLDGELSLVNQEGLTVRVSFYPVKFDYYGKEGTDRR